MDCPSKRWFYVAGSYLRGTNILGYEIGGCVLCVLSLIIVDLMGVNATGESFGPFPPHRFAA